MYFSPDFQFTVIETKIDNKCLRLEENGRDTQFFSLQTIIKSQSIDFSYWNHKTTLAAVNS